ncbi:MAG: urea transporter ATP-binding protein [Polyangiaceae bacterium]|jgi:urea transport system ATP-binding protein|nr:urea transporter ATP-binding protein [Polyangiaceae bacterium]
MLEVSGLNQFYGESHTLWDMELKVPEGSCVCLMGRNGVGKTTLLKSIMGALPVRSGKITFMGQDIAPTRAEIRARKGIGWVPQGREVFSMMTVQENLRTGLAARADKTKEIPERIFELFPVLKSMLQRRGGDLSGGQQQQLAMGRALALDPKLLILDEPTEGIQPNIVSMIGDVLISLKEKGLTQLLVEQKLPFARRVGDYFCIMERGRAVATGKMSELSDEIVNKHLKV